MAIGPSRKRLRAFAPARFVPAQVREMSSVRVRSVRITARVRTDCCPQLVSTNGLVLARDGEPGEPGEPEPNRRIATDLTTVWTRRDGVVALVPTIDCGDRTAVIEVTKDQHGPAVLASVEAKLIPAFGKRDNVPDGVELRTDHGPQYTGSDCQRSAHAGGSTTRSHPWAARRETPSSSASSARSRMSYLAP